MCLFVPAADLLEDQSDLLLIPRQQELLGSQAKNCDVPVSIEKTGLEDKGQYKLSYVLFRSGCNLKFVVLLYSVCNIQV